jgi:UPF0755 protein
MRSEEIDQGPEREAGNRRSGRLGPLSFRSSVLVYICLVISSIAIGGAMAVTLLNLPTGVGMRQVEIQKGMGVSRISSLLYSHNLIRSPRLLRLLSLLNGSSRKLTAGIHPFHAGMTTWEILQELERHRDVTRDVTIPEGMRKEHTARILSEGLDLSEDKLIALMDDAEFCKTLGVDAENLEGYLFPETYKFSLMMEEKQVIQRLVKQFKRVFDSQMRAEANRIGMTVHETVIMASIIEGEAQVGDERPIISAVYHNRLKKRMRLQADPTVQYAIVDGPRRLFYKDYRIDSAYNTYKHGGLPPGPIMSPGEASLKAALFPAEVDYLYFVARGDGSHIFSRTTREHEKSKGETRWARRRSWGGSKKR